jgi:hypothetical protein
MDKPLPAPRQVPSRHGDRRRHAADRARSRPRPTRSRNPTARSATRLRAMRLPLEGFVRTARPVPTTCPPNQVELPSRGGVCRLGATEAVARSAGRPRLRARLAGERVSGDETTYAREGVNDGSQTPCSSQTSWQHTSVRALHGYPRKSAIANAGDKRGTKYAVLQVF